MNQNIFCLTNGVIVSNGEEIRDKAVIVENSVIREVVDNDAADEKIKRIDLKGNFLAPGLIDLQLNGAGGAFFGGDPTPDGLDIMERATLREGTSGFLATAATNTLETYRKMIKYANEYRPKARGNFLGLHFEGPYINPVSKGAHPESLIRKANIGEVQSLLEGANGVVKMVTLAPELQPEEVIEYLDKLGIVVSAGHSGASYEEGMHFFEGKKRMVTHLYNAMPKMHHRNPGLIPAIFRSRPYTGIVADGIHVSYPMIWMAKRLLGDSLLLVTDAATTCHKGMYQHTLKDDHYVTIGKDGKETLSASALSMLKAVRNCVQNVDIPLGEAINMASLYPARVLGMEEKVGLIRKGYDANLIVFDANFECRRVFLKGIEYPL